MCPFIDIPIVPLSMRSANEERKLLQKIQQSMTRVSLNEKKKESNQDDYNGLSLAMAMRSKKKTLWIYFVCVSIVSPD